MESIIIFIFILIISLYTYGYYMYYNLKNQKHLNKCNTIYILNEGLTDDPYPDGLDHKYDKYIL
jgi:hypothetical protein